MKRSLAWILLIPALVALGGYFLERSDFLAPMRRSIRSQTVPTAILDYGAFGKIIKQLGVVQAVQAEGRKSGKEGIPMEPEKATLFAKKRQVGDFAFKANPGGRTELPSSRIVTPADFKPGWPLISIVIDEKELRNPKDGLMTHPRARGREWERLAYVSYFEQGRLLFASGAGLRLHGGSGRTLKNRISFRLYFRNEFGANRFTPGIFSPATDPLKRLVVHVDWPQTKPFTSCLAFDISRRMGCVVPEVKPAMLMINGDLKGIYFLSEHVGRRQWRAHFNHNDFLFYKYRGSSDPESRKRFAALKQWTRNPDIRMTMSEAARRVDLENFSRNLFSYVFCGTDDWIQGVAAMDLKQQDPRWFWINWDMDRSFWFQHGARAGVKAENIWEKYAFEFVFNPKASNPRSLLFRRLVKESPRYREYFVRLVTDLMNHRITEEFLLSRVAHYRRLAVAYGRRNLESIDMMGRFSRFRAEYIRGQMQAYFGLDAPFLCRVAGERDVPLEVDGHPEHGGYRGWYFKGQILSIREIESNEAKIAYWLVNGEKVTKPLLRFAVAADTVIRPVFAGSR